VLDNDEVFKAFYGDQIIPIAGNFAVKNTLDVRTDANKELLHKAVRDTKRLTDLLKEYTEEALEDAK
jgi:hypothetical protein